MHLLQLAHIPGRHQQSPRIWVPLYLFYQTTDLVHMSSVRRPPRAPLMSINGTQFAVGACPLVPNTHPMVMQILHIRVATQKPQQLVYNGTQMQFLRSQQRKTVVKMEPHLVSEHTDSARTRTILLRHAVVQHMLQQVKILFHSVSYILTVNPLHRTSPHQFARTTTRSSSRHNAK